MGWKVEKDKEIVVVVVVGGMYVSDGYAGAQDVKDQDGGPHLIAGG